MKIKSDSIIISNDYSSVEIIPKLGAHLVSFKIFHKNLEYELLVQNKNNSFLQESGSFIMAPWVNRILNGELNIMNKRYYLPINSSNYAMHGLVKNQTWNIKKLTENSILLETSLSKPWPFSGKIKYLCSLKELALVQTITIDTEDNIEFPVAIGWHPWFKRSLNKQSGLIKIEASGEWELDSKMKPSGKIINSDLYKKIRSGIRLEPFDSDSCFLLSENGSGYISWPELTLGISGDPTITNMMVYTTDKAICLEPQTSTINAFQLHNNGLEKTVTTYISKNNPFSSTTSWAWKFHE